MGVGRGLKVNGITNWFIKCEFMKKMLQKRNKRSDNLDWFVFKHVKTFENVDNVLCPAAKLPDYGFAPDGMKFEFYVNGNL